MWKLAAVLLGLIIFAGLFSLGNTVATAVDLVHILFTALFAIVIMVLAIGIAPWLSDKVY